MRLTLSNMVFTLLAGVPALSSAQVSTQQTTATPAQSGELQEVVVTATRRSESQLQVPMSISVIGTQQLKDEQIQSFDDYAQQIPNLTFAAAGGNFGDLNSRSVAIRGIQGANVTGFYLDDLPMPISLGPRVLDLERIEVLRGPQGTLYGARSMGGAVREITTPPDPNQFTSEVHAQGTQVDGGGAGYQVDATLNIPLIADHLGLRITPFSGEDPGYINRVYPNPANPAQDIEDKNTASAKYEGLFASLLWRPTDDLVIRPTYMYQRTNTNGLTLADYTADNLTNFRHEDVPEGYTDRWYYVGGTINYTTPIGVITSATSIFNRANRDLEDVSEWAAYAFDAPIVPFSSGPLHNPEHSATEEIRFASSWTAPLQFIGGLYYSKDTETYDDTQDIPSYAALFGSPIAFSEWTPTYTKNAAVYGELTYAITPQWLATVGGRYSKDTQTSGGYEWGFAAGALSFADRQSTYSASSDHVVTPKYLVKYQPNDDVNIYVDAAKGYRPGSGQVPPPPSFCASNYELLGLTPGQVTSYRPDTVWSYELGGKMRALDRRVSLSGAVFWIDWTNIQETIDFTQCGFGATLNTAKARSRGAEFEGSAVLLEGLTVNGGVGYTDAKILTGGLATFLKEGEPLPQVAPWTANFNAQYDRPVTASTTLVLIADYSYTDHSFSVTNSPTIPRVRPSYELVNLKSGFRQGKFEYALFVKNIFDVHPNLGDQLSAAAEDPGRPRWFTGPPRTYGFDIRAKF
jgi:iron complex outermembrane recepter protein